MPQSHVLLNIFETQGSNFEVLCRKAELSTRLSIIGSVYYREGILQFLKFSPFLLEEGIFFV